MCQDDENPAIHDRGLSFDLDTLRAQRDPQAHRSRRAALGLLGAGAATAGGVLLTGRLASPASAATATAATSAAACTTKEIPNETAGPYPGDGSNGPDVLGEAGITRRDIRRSFGSSTTRATGVGFDFVLTLTDTSTCQVVPGLAVYAWHCDSLGRYSMYSDGIDDENYLRGLQVTNSLGKVRFTSIYPGCYSGRWPHVHFEVYRSRYQATHGGTILATSQLALPRAPSANVYANDSRYTGSSRNLNQISLRSDNVFKDDGGARQLVSMTGSISKGYVARLTVPVDV